MRAAPVRALESWSGAETVSLASRAAILIVAAWLFVCSGALFPLIAMDANSTLSESSASALRLLLLPSLLATPVLVFYRWRAIGRLLGQHAVLVLILGWIWLSATWSVDPAVTLRRALSFSANTLIVCFVVVTFPPALILRILAGVALTILAMSLLLAIVAPHLAFMPGTGEFRGVFTHKNGMGFSLVVAAVATALAWHHRLFPMPVLVLASTAIFLIAVPVGSATTLMLLVMLAALHVPLRVSALPDRQAAGGLLVVLVGVVTIVLPLLLFREQLFAAFGRDATLTGRTELWDFIDGMIAKLPFTGFGYGAFFEVASVKDQLIATIGWAAPNAHHGYREILLGLGVTGLGLTLLLLVRGWWQALRVVAIDPHDPASRFAFLFLCLYLVRNLSESDLLAQSDLSWILAALAILMPTAWRTAAARPVETVQ
jgi:exopolysaccharide production protein ExoQ